MIRISVPFHWSVPTNRTPFSTRPLSVQLKRSYSLPASMKAYSVGKKVQDAGAARGKDITP